HRRQAGDGTHRHAAAGVSLQTVVHADERRFDRGEVVGQLLDVGDGQAADGRHALWPVLLEDALAQGVGPQTIALQIVVVAPAVAQMVRARSEAPRRWKKRRSRLLPWSWPIVPP